MSRAFVKESNGEDAATRLPDRAISPHPNWVTADGLAMIDREIERLAAALQAAQPAADRAEQASLVRDLRYWKARRATAEVVASPADNTTVHFGSTVAIRRDDGRRQTYRIVGEDEADPPKGTLSYTSPLARALLGKAVGEVIRAGSGEAEVVAID